jgi:hypothetical protein
MNDYRRAGRAGLTWIKRFHESWLAQLDCSNSVSPLALLAHWPSAREPVPALPPQMGMVLVWTGLSRVALALLSHGFMIGDGIQNTLKGFLVHAFAPDRHGAVCWPIELSA